VVFTKFDFKKEWHLVEPHLDDPEVLESLDEGMHRFSQYYKWNHLPLWNRKNGIGPWQYSRSDIHATYIDEMTYEDPDVDRLEMKYIHILEKMGLNIDELEMHPIEFLFEQDIPKFRKVADSYHKEYGEIEEKYLPKENTYKWYQCFHACFFLAEWQETLARKVYPQYNWCTYQKHKENASEWDAGHSTTMGRWPKGNILIFDILLFESTSIEGILEVAGVDPTKLQ
jgi:hypothetical protein